MRVSWPIILLAAACADPEPSDSDVGSDTLVESDTERDSEADSDSEADGDSEADSDTDGRQHVIVSCDQDGDDALSLACGGADCNDLDDDIGPAEAEQSCNGLDDDCDGQVDEVGLECRFQYLTFEPWLIRHGTEPVVVVATNASWWDIEVTGVSTTVEGTTIDVAPLPTVLGPMGDMAFAIGGGDPYASGVVTVHTDAGDFELEVQPRPCAPYDDADGDGVYSTACGGGDCDDTDPGIHPRAVERCNGGDDDCNGIVDDALQAAWFLDLDGDGFGAGDAQPAVCPGPGWAKTSADCDDADPLRTPGVADLCDGVDNDCDGRVDEGVWGAVSCGTGCVVDMPGGLDRGLAFTTETEPGVDGLTTSFASALATADVDADGCHDVWVQSQTEDGGLVSLFRGPITSRWDAGAADWQLQGTTTGFGTVLAAHGDILAVGDPTGVGTVTVYTGLDGGEVAVLTGSLRATIGRSVDILADPEGVATDVLVGDDQGVGWKVSVEDLTSASIESIGTVVYDGVGTGTLSIRDAGDMDGDGTTDIVVGEANEREAWVVYGGAANPELPSSQRIRLTDDIQPPLQVFGMDDITRDGVRDGWVQGVDHWSSAGPTGGIWSAHRGPNDGRVVVNAGGRWDERLPRPGQAVGDFDGDGRPDLAYGSNRNTVSLRLAASEYSWVNSYNLIVRSSEDASDVYGRALAAADLNGDGLHDLVVGVPGRGDGTGALDVVYGEPMPHLIGPEDRDCSQEPQGDLIEPLSLCVLTDDYDLLNDDADPIAYIAGTTQERAPLPGLIAHPGFHSEPSCSQSVHMATLLTEDGHWVEIWTNRTLESGPIAPGVWLYAKIEGMLHAIVDDQGVLYGQKRTPSAPGWDPEWMPVDPICRLYFFQYSSYQFAFNGVVVPHPGQAVIEYDGFDYRVSTEGYWGGGGTTQFEVGGYTVERLAPP